MNTKEVINNCPYGKFTGICDITNKPCKEVIICNTETVWVNEDTNKQEDTHYVFR